MKNLKENDGRIKTAPELKAKIIKFCLEHPTEKKQLIADAHNLSLRIIQKWMKAIKKPEKPITDAEKQQKAIKKLKAKYPDYVETIWNIELEKGKQS